MRLLITFARNYPLNSTLMVLALLLAGLIEGIGLSMLLPLIGIAISNPSGAGPLPAVKNGAADSMLERMVTDAFATLGITPTLGMLLIVLIATVTLKSGLLLLVNKQIGYTVARVATDLRLELLQALRACRWEYFIRQPLGSLANSIASETGRTSKAYKSGILMTAEFFQALMYCIMAFLVSWKATVISLTAGFAILYAVRRYLKKSRRAGRRQTDLRKALLRLFTDTLQSIKPLRTMARENASDHLLRKKDHRPEQGFTETSSEQRISGSLSTYTSYDIFGRRNLRIVNLLANDTGQRDGPGVSCLPIIEATEQSSRTLSGNGY